MLILTRKLNESIFIGDDISLTVVGIDGDRVSIGIDAPKNLKILRSELAEGTRLSNKASLDLTPELFRSIRARIKQEITDQSGDEPQ